MDKKNVNMALELISQDIMLLRKLMNEVSKQVDSLSHPIMVEISEVMDIKLNQRNQLLNQCNPSPKSISPTHIRVISHHLN